MRNDRHKPGHSVSLRERGPRSCRPSSSVWKNSHLTWLSFFCFLVKEFVGRQIYIDRFLSGLPQQLYGKLFDRINESQTKLIFKMCNTFWKFKYKCHEKIRVLFCNLLWILASDVSLQEWVKAFYSCVLWQPQKSRPWLQRLKQVCAVCILPRLT